MAETPGSLVDKLSIVNIKLWFVQEFVIKSSLMGEEEYQRLGADAIMAKVRTLNDLNMERTALINEYNAMWERDTGVAPGAYAKIHKIKE